MAIRLSRFVIAMMSCLCCLASFAFAKKEIPQADIPQKIVQNLIEDLQKRRYEKAEQTLSVLLDQKKQSANGLRLLEEVYADPRLCTPPEQIKAWSEARKNAHFPKVILGKCLTEEAWRTRGNGPAKKVSEQQRATIDDLLHQAQPLLESAWKLQPKDPQSASILISLSLLQGQSNDVIDTWFRKAVGADDSWMAAYRANFYRILPMWRGSEQELMHFLRDCVSNSPQGSIVYTLPLELLEMSIYRPTRLDIMVALFPEDGEKAKLIDSAINRYRYEFPVSPWPDFYQGLKNRCLSNDEESVTDFDKSLLRDPDNTRTLAARSEVLYKLNQFDRAEADLLQLIRVSPEDTRAYAQLGALQILIHNDVEKGVKLYEEACRLEKLTSVRAAYFLDLGEILAQKSSYDKAIVYYGKALETDPTCSRALMRRADINESIGKFQAALEDMQALGRLDPKFEEMAKQRAEQLVRAQVQSNQQSTVPQPHEVVPSSPGGAPPYPAPSSAQQVAVSSPVQPLPAPVKDLVPQLGECENLFFRRMTQEATTCVTEFLQKVPSQATALALRARIASDLEGDQGRATEFFSAAVGQDPRNELYLLELGRAMFLNQQWEQAIEVYSKLLEINNAHGEAYYQRGLSLEAVGRTEGAIKDMQLAKIHGFAPPELNAFLQRHSQPFPVPKVNAQEEQRLTAEEDMRMGRFEQAEKTFLTMLQNNHQDDYVLFQLGHIYRQAKSDPKKALEYYSLAIAANPMRQEYYIYRAALYSFQDRCDLAVNDYSKILEMSPGKENILADRANCYMKTGEFTNAEADLKLALKTAQSDKEYYNKLLADISSKTGNIDESQNKSAKFFINRGIQLASNKKIQQAKEDFQKAISLEKNNASAHYQMGCLYKDELKDAHSALLHFNQAIEVNKGEAVYFLKRGLTYYDLKKFSKAKIDFTSGIQIDANSAQMFYYRGCCNKELEQKNEAKKDLLRAQSIDPSWRDAVTGLLKAMET